MQKQLKITFKNKVIFAVQLILKIKIMSLRQKQEN